LLISPILGVTHKQIEKNATENDIRKAYKKLFRQAHPDKGREEEMMKEINAAHAILSDLEQRPSTTRKGSSLLSIST